MTQPDPFDMVVVKKTSEHFRNAVEHIKRGKGNKAMLAIFMAVRCYEGHVLTMTLEMRQELTAYMDASTTGTVAEFKASVNALTKTLGSLSNGPR